MHQSSFDISGHIVDIHSRHTFPGKVRVSNGSIQSIRPMESAPEQFILPGFVDAHVHIESSMLVPTEFARLAVVHGTVATISDPHEIANVLGADGVEYMIENAALTPFHICFGAPSCVPATLFETAGAEINAQGIEQLLSRPEVGYLAEVMNYPGVLSRDPSLMAKIECAQKAGKPIDGHAPGLRGNDAKRYAEVGITTDHECFTKEEALDKLRCGMKIIIREGSAAKNFDALKSLLREFPDQIMFCSDDKHPDDLIEGHINALVRRAIGEGYDLYDVVRAASLNPVEHYSLPIGLLREGDSADFIVVGDLTNFEVRETYLRGQLVSQGGESLLTRENIKIVNNFSCREVSPSKLQVKQLSNLLRTIDVIDGELITEGSLVELPEHTGALESDPRRNVLKMVVVNRYFDAPPAIAFVRNFGLRNGAIASSVAHDSHNVIAVGVSDEDISQAINLVIREKGGISFAAGSLHRVLGLPIAGLMSPREGKEVAAEYQSLDALAKEHGCVLRAPYMTLSFLALLVIPKLKLSDKGLFDGGSFEFVDLFQ